MRSYLALGLGGGSGAWSGAGAKLRNLWVASRPTGFPPLEVWGRGVGCVALSRVCRSHPLLQGQPGGPRNLGQAQKRHS